MSEQRAAERAPLGWVAMGLVLLTVAAYAGVGANGFIGVDDPLYVTENPHVLAGLNAPGIRWAFQNADAFNWHPLTWLSHMLDVELFGRAAASHHWMSLLLHVANTVLLLVALERMTGRLPESAAVAALFALHPLHVESVAWISERKDVLSTFFWFVGLWLYARYAERPGVVRYLEVLVAFVLGLMAKSMLVTFPCLLLVLDYWPLGRWSRPLAGPSSRLRTCLRLVAEKIPMFAASALASLLAIVAQRPGTRYTLALFPFADRLGNALRSYLAYLAGAVWPFGLGPFYPHPGAMLLWQAAGAGLVVASITVAAIWSARRCPYLAVGWLWFVGTLVPVIGLLQVGEQAMADRYTYVPLVGIFIALVWGASEMTARSRMARIVAVSGLVIVLFVLSVQSWRQVRLWKDTLTLFEHTAQVTRDNYFAHAVLGIAFLGQGEPEAAEAHIRQALLIKPDHAESLNNLCMILLGRGDVDGAIEACSRAISASPALYMAHYNLARALAQRDDIDGAVAHLKKAAALRPRDAAVQLELARYVERLGRPGEAELLYRKAMRIDPQNAGARLGFSNARRREARSHATR